MVFIFVVRSRAFVKGVFLLLSIALIVGCSSADENNPSESEGAAVNDSNPPGGAFADIPVGFTDDGYPYRGDPNAPVTVYEYSDYLCPFCGRHTNETMPVLLDQFARTGQVKFVFRDYPIEALHPTADIGHVAAICVAEQGAPLFWEMHDLLYSRQNQWSGLQDPTEFVVGLALEIGVDMKAFEKCSTDQKTIDTLNASVTEARDLGFNGTPSFNFQFEGNDELYPYVGAQPAAEFSRIFNSLVASGKLPVEPTPEPPVLPFWLTTEGLAADPAQEGYTIAGDAFKGDPRAELVVIELSDFQCPSCAVHTLEIQPLIDEQLVETGQVRWVLKNLPVSEHQRAPIAAAAAECAGEQSYYWEMHDLLFENQEAWSGSDDDSTFLTLAEDLDLDVDQFSACLNGRAALEGVLKDLFDAQQAGLFRTPTFILAYNDDVTLLEGSREQSVFIGILESALARIENSE